MDFVGLEKLSLVDWDGKLTCTLFMAGCNFRCPFCHNSSLVIDPSSQPIIPFSKIIDFLKSQVNRLEAVCITGGEPTLMSDLVEKIRQIKELGYLVKLDTNGTNPKVLKRLVDEHLIDYVAMDIKNDFEAYLATIGLKSFDLGSIKESIEYLKEDHIEYEFRTTLVSELHNLKNIENIGRLLENSKCLFLQRFVDNGSCIKSNLKEVTKEKALEYKDLLTKYIKRVELRGY